MKGYIVTNEDGEKEVYSNPPKRLKVKHGLNVWTYDRKDSNDMQDCIYLHYWEGLNLPDAIKNQTWDDDPIEIDITIKAV